MFWRPEVGQQHRHLVKRPAPDSLVVAAAGQVVADLLLVDPQQTVQCDDVGVADERQAVIARVQRLAVRRYLDEEPAAAYKPLHRLSKYCLYFITEYMYSHGGAHECYSSLK